jgi:hypothetical protein
MSIISVKPGGGLDAIQAEFHLGLAHQIMRYIARMTAEGDTKQLLDLGLDHSDIGRLSRMNIPEADRLSRLSTNFLNTVGIIDRDKLLLAIDYLEREREQQGIIDTLFHLKATLPLMNLLFSMEREEFVQRRKLLGIRDQGGRIRHLTEPEESQVYQLWVQNRHMEIPHRLIMIGNESKIPLGSVYHFLCTFASDEFHEPV